MGNTATPVAAAAPAAPAAPAPSAPSTPSSTPTSTPSTPAPQPPAAPASPAAPSGSPTEGAAAPATPQAPAAPGGPQAPQQSDFPDTQDGLEDYLNARSQWAAEHPEQSAIQAAVAPAESAAAAPAEAAAAAEQQEAPKPAEGAPAGESGGAPTPAELDGWTAKDPAFKAAIDANPELKGALFEMARANERAKPVLEMLPTIEDAQYAVQQASTLVDLRTNLMLAVENPDRLAPAMDGIKAMFRTLDDKGEPVRDAAGNYQLDEDYHLLAGEFAKERHSAVMAPLQQRHAALQERIKRDAYATPEAKAQDEAAAQDVEYAIAAAEYYQELVNTSGAAGTKGMQLPDLPANATPEQVAFQKRLEEQLGQLNQGKDSATKEQRKARRETFINEYTLAHQSGVGQMIDQVLAQEKERGNVIPAFLLNRKARDANGRELQVREFARDILTEFNTAIKRNPRDNERMQRLEMLPPGPESRAVADAFYGEMRQRYLGPIIQRSIKTMQDGILQFQDDRTKQQNRVAEVANVEPRSGSTPVPQTLSREQRFAQARAAAEKLPGWDAMTPQEQLEAELNQRHELAAR